MNIKLLFFKFQVDNCIKICHKFLANDFAYVKNSKEQNLFNEIKEVILPEMLEFKKITEHTVLPPASERYIKSFAYALKLWDCENWNIKHPSKLYKKLLKLNNLFKAL